jgi:excisionase family DNA binding protein
MADVAEMGGGTDPRAFCSVRDLTHRWDVSGKTILRLVKRGRLRAIRLGMVIRFPAEEVARFEREGGAAARRIERGAGAAILQPEPEPEHEPGPEPVAVAEPGVSPSAEKAARLAEARRRAQSPEFAAAREQLRRNLAR